MFHFQAFDNGDPWLVKLTASPTVTRPNCWPGIVLSLSYPVIMRSLTSDWHVTTCRGFCSFSSACVPCVRCVRSHDTMWNSLTPPSHGYPASRAITTGGRCTCQAPASCTIGHRLCDDVHARCQKNPKTSSCFVGSLGPKVGDICICYYHYIPLHYQNHLLLLWFLACFFPAMCFHSIARKMLLAAVCALECAVPQS